MKPVNLQSLLASYDNLERATLDKYLSYSATRLKAHEWGSLRALRDYLAGGGILPARVLDAFYLGYKIPQIGKEFDLLKLCIEPDGHHSIINIELKTDADKEKVERQLRRNHYYLKFAECRVYLFTFVEHTKTLYTWVDDKLEVCSRDMLLDLLMRVIPRQDVVLDHLFDPKHYLISPFNDPERFMQGEYFLTTHQEMIERNVLTWADDQSKGQFVSIEGAAGTGKTLLTYHIARQLKEAGYRVLVLHCASINHGQLRLIEDYDWEIREAKDLVQIKTSLCDFLIIDEAQRLRSWQLKTLTALSCRCILSFDPLQCLSEEEFRLNADQTIRNLASPNNHKLTNSIRTNKELVGFITQILDSRKNWEIEGADIEVCNFYSAKELRSYLEYLDELGWITPQYTPLRYDTAKYERYFASRERSAHGIIGLEYDGIVAVIDEHFYYDDKGLLCCKKINTGNTYSLKSMFYQIVTRARKRLCIIVLNNDPLLERCLDILGRGASRSEVSRD